MEITKQVKQKQRIFNILTQEEIFGSFISTDHCTLGLLFPKGPDILNAVRIQKYQMLQKELLLKSNPHFEIQRLFAQH